MSRLPEILDSKAPLIASLANALPPPHKFMPRRELAGEIEWAKNRMIPSGALPRRPRRAGASTAHPRRADGRHLPGVRASQGAHGPDRLRGHARCSAVQLLDEYPAAAEAVRERFQAFTVDEYQDVNPLQQALLERWLGGSRRTLRGGRRLPDDLLVHGGFARLPARVPGSLPERHGRPAGGELPLHPPGADGRQRAGRTLGGFEKTLAPDATRRPNPTARALADPDAEVAFVLGRGPASARGRDPVRGDGGDLSHQRSLGGVRGGVRDGRRPVSGPRRRVPAPAGPRVRCWLSAPDAEDRGVAGRRGRHRRAGIRSRGRSDDTEEVTRQADLGRLRALATEFAAAHPDGDAAAFWENSRGASAPERPGAA